MRSLLPLLFPPIVLVALAVAPAAARAQDADPLHEVAARALFQEGVALAREGDYAEATDRFRRSRALHPAPAVAFNLAAALGHQGGLVEATEILAQLLRDPAISTQVRASAESLRAQIAPRLAGLRVRLSGDAAGVRVELDGRALPEAAIGVSVPIDPGTHEVRALRGDEEAVSERLELAEGEVRDVSLTIAAGEIPTPEPPREALVQAPSTRAGGGISDDVVWIGLGIGAAVVLVAAVTITAVVATTPGASMPVTGNATPGVLRW